MPAELSYEDVYGVSTKPDPTPELSYDQVFGNTKSPELSYDDVFRSGSSTPASDKALAETPVQAPTLPADARLQSFGVDTAPPEASYRPEEHPVAEKVAGEVMKPLQSVGETAKGFVTGFPQMVADVGRLAGGGPTEQLGVIAKGGIQTARQMQQVKDSTVFSQPWWDAVIPLATQAAGEFAGVRASAPVLERPPVQIGEPNASRITIPESVPQPEIRPPMGEETPLRQPGETTGAQVQEPVVAGAPQEEAPIWVTETLAELKRRNVVTPGEVLPKPEGAGEATSPVVAPPTPSIEGAPSEPVTPETDISQTGPLNTGVSNKAYEEIYGDASPAVVAGKGPKEWKAIGQARLNDFQITGNPINDPYVVLTDLRQGNVPVAKIPHDVSLLRAEHQRLVEDARQSEGTPQYPEKAQAAFSMATAIKQVAHGPASDVFRSLQEHDVPRYDNVTDFDQAIRERAGRESTPEEKTAFSKIATDVRAKGDAAGKEIEIAQKQVRKYRGKEKMSFDQAAKSIRDQIESLTKDCVL